MSGKNVLRNKDTVDEQALEQIRDSDRSEPELRRSVEQEIQGTVDTNHPDAGVTGLTLETEERMHAREWEIERTRRRFDSRQDSEREARTRRAAGRGSRERRRTFAKRAASVDRWCDPDEADPRAQLSRSELGAVNEEAARLAEQLRGWSRAAISRRLAERVADGRGMTDAVVDVYDELDQAAGTVIPIEKVGEVNRGEVSVEGRVAQLWNPSSPKIQNVGLLEDESGRTRVTIWKASEAPWIEEGDTVRIHGASVSWYEGRASLAVTGWSSIHFPERGRWWE